MSTVHLRSIFREQTRSRFGLQRVVKVRLQMRLPRTVVQSIFGTRSHDCVTFTRHSTFGTILQDCERTFLHSVFGTCSQDVSNPVLHVFSGTRLQVFFQVVRHRGGLVTLGPLSALWGSSRATVKSSE